MAPAYARPSEVLILEDGLIMGGGQRFALRLARVMRADGIPVAFAAPASSRFAQEASAGDFEIVDVSYPRLVPPAVTAMPPTVTRLRRLLAKLPPNALVIGNTARCQAYATAALLTLSQRPLFVHLMQEQDSAHRPSARAVYRRIGALVAVGENAAETYRTRLPNVEVTRVSNFVSADDIRRLAASRTAPPGGERPVVGVLGRMIPEKGILELIEELAEIPGAWERLRVAAPEQDAAYTARVRERITDLRLQDRVELLGEIHDLNAFFASIDVLAVPSTGNEGQPTVIIEALLYARPVIVRAPLWSSDYDELPIQRYDTVQQLAAALAHPAPAPVTPDALEQRFNASQLVARLHDAAVRQRDQQQARERPEELGRPIGGRRPGGEEWTRHLMRHRNVTRHGSPVPTIGSYLVFAAGLPRTALRRGRRFAFAGQDFPYLYDTYNLTWMNERAVEVPIARHAVEARPGERVLEIGNVLSHYGIDGHEVVDKYEEGPGVRNIDVLDLEPDRRWDLIVSISTLEHVGVDDAPRDPARGAAAAALLAGRLAPGGELLITVPSGYNAELDRALVAGELPGLELRALRRTGRGPRWEEADPAAVLGVGYDWRNSTARAVFVGRLRAPTDPADR